MLRWFSSKHRRGTSSPQTLYRVSLDIPVSDAVVPSHPPSALTDSSKQRSPSLRAGADSAPREKRLSSLRRRSLPALHFQEDNSSAMMSNPPVFTNPLRRRGCCDHQHAETMYQYRAEAIEREAASQQAFRPPVEAT